MKRIVLWIPLLFCTLVQTLGQTPQIDFKALDAYYQKMMRDWDVPSVAIGIVKDGELVFTGNYGVLEVGQNQKPNENTLYAIASNSKAFTSAILGMLVQEGKLGWNDKVKKYLPYFEVYDSWVSNEVTVRDLLCHRVGFGTFSGDVIWYKSNLTSEEIIRRFKYLPKAFDFRAGFGYSNLMYITAGELIKKITGKSWNQNVKERIFQPLGMDRTITSPKELQAKGNYVTPHGRENDVNIPIAWEDWEEIGATGGIISSVKDVSKWMIFNLNHGILGNDTLLTRVTRNMVWTPHNNFIVDHTKTNDMNRHFSAYGLGWGLSDYHGLLRVAHTGGFDGMITAVTLIPDENLGVVVLTNGMKSPIHAATYHALDLFLGINGKDWSAEYLERANKKQKEDSRVTDIKTKRVLNTKPSLSLEAYSGVYKSDIYGEIKIDLINEKLRMQFEHTRELSATLEHWHYDVWEIKWDKKHAWFNFGTVRFKTDNNMSIKGLDFEVPNDDIFFEELKPYKIKGPSE
ncbi:serine hydrolase [Ulvibacterium sp.]|uniref:serine hydrolase n=1 Tax=Ulvibacterium sp. TaxID=2665914 RepID=UPI00262C5185|nr:serine hydrolase [Ulvibacterium sp.]